MQLFLILLFHVSYIQLELLAIQNLSLTIHFPILSLEIISGNMTEILSDYLPQFSFAANILSSLSTQRSNFYERDVSKFNQKKLHT